MNYNAPDVVCVSIDAIYTTIAALTVSATVRSIAATADDAITAANAFTFGATAAIVSVFALSVNEIVPVNNAGAIVAVLIVIPINTTVASR